MIKYCSQTDRISGTNKFTWNPISISYNPRWFCGCCWWTWTLPTWNPDRLWRTRRPAWSTSPTPSTSSPPSSPPWPSCRSTSLNVFFSLNSMCRRSIQWCCAGPCGRLWWPLSSSSFASSPPSQCSGKIKTHASVDMSPSPIPINRHQKSLIGFCADTCQHVSAYTSSPAFSLFGQDSWWSRYWTVTPHVTYEHTT